MSKQEEIKLLIKESDLSFVDIAKRVGVHINTVYNINRGKTHFLSTESYPLRSRDGDRITKLRRKLETPTLKALPSPLIYSIYLVDYISILALLNVPIDCLLLFKKLYIKQVQEIIGAVEVTDEQLLALIKMNPQQPAILNKLIEAYLKPTPKNNILEYWRVSGFLTAEESKDIYRLFAIG